MRMQSMGQPNCTHAVTHRAAKIKLYSTIIPVLLVIWRRRRARSEPRRLLCRNPLFNSFHMLKHVKHGRRQTVESLRTLPDPYLIYDDSTFRRQFRMTIASAQQLYSFIEFNSHLRVKRASIHPKVALLVFLQRLGQLDTAHTLGLTYGMSQSTVVLWTRRIMKAIQHEMHGLIRYVII